MGVTAEVPNTELKPPRFALFELAYLLAGRDDPNVQRTRELMGIPEVMTGAEVEYQAGLSGLITRGLIDADAEGLLPRNEAGLLALILGTATQWVSIAVRTVDLVDLSLLVGSERGLCLVRRAPGPTFDVVFIKPGEQLPDVSARLVTNLLDADPAKAVMVRSADVEEDHALLLIRTVDGDWQLGENPAFPGDADWPAPDLVPVPTTRESALAALRELLDPAKATP